MIAAAAMVVKAFCCLDCLDVLIDMAKLVVVIGLYGVGNNILNEVG